MGTEFGGLLGNLGAQLGAPIRMPPPSDAWFRAMGQDPMNNALGNGLSGMPIAGYSALQNIAPGRPVLVNDPYVPREPSFAWMWLIPVWTIISIGFGLLWIR